MKLVIKIGSKALVDGAAMRALAKALGQLREEGHHIAIVHGCPVPFIPDLSSLAEGFHTENNRILEGFALNEFPHALLISGVNKTLVAILESAGVPAFGLCGGDGNIVRLRKRGKNGGSVAFEVEVAAVEPFWLNILSDKGAIPVIANIGLGWDHKYHCVNSTELGTACAIGWRADVLVFLASGEIPKGDDGSAMRWIEAGKIDALGLHVPMSAGMMSKLIACGEALKHGVQRTRILPVSAISNIASFFFSKIEAGTEVILTCTTVEESNSVLELIDRVPCDEKEMA